MASQRRYRIKIFQKNQVRDKTIRRSRNVNQVWSLSALTARVIGEETRTCITDVKSRHWPACSPRIPRCTTSARCCSPRETRDYEHTRHYVQIQACDVGNQHPNYEPSPVRHISRQIISSCLPAGLIEDDFRSRSQRLDCQTEEALL